MAVKKDNVELICGVSELAGLFDKSKSLDDFLQAVVSTVAYHMQAAVCSIYLVDPEREELVLRANQGLNPDLIGQLRMKLDEGLTGRALKELRPIREAVGSRSPYFKFIRDSHEENFAAFLAVPILKGLQRIGVLVVQDPQPDYFDENDSRALQAITAQLSTTIESAQLFLSLRRFEEADGVKVEELTNVLVRGKAVSPGLCFGKATIVRSGGTARLQEAGAAITGKTLDDFEFALSETERQLKELQNRLEEKLSDVATLIFSAHLLILKDSEFSGLMRTLIESGTEPGQAIGEVITRYLDLFSKSSNPKLQEKVEDLKDLGHRLLHNLDKRDPDEKEYEGEVIIADELLPSSMLKLATQGVEGLVLLSGGVSSHISILARSLKVPMILCDDWKLLDLENGTPVQLDADQGNLILRPTEEVLEKYRSLLATRGESAEASKKISPETYTLDGTRVYLLANVNLLSDLESCLNVKAEGIGLYRSEFPFIVRNDFPSEEEQFRIYRKLIEGMKGREVYMRTLDVGGDKMLSYYSNIHESNPFLGLRAIRFSLKNRHIFINQLKAMMRAGFDRDIGIIFPLISSVDDFLQAREVVDECRGLLDQDGVEYNPSPKLGAMIETPSVIEVAEELTREADFVSIGSNDLVQYVLAVDRTNEQLSDMYLSHHPAVLRSLYRVVQAALQQGKPVSICGDMTGDEKLLPFLLGIGIRRFSVDPNWIPRIQGIMQNIDINDARKKVQTMLRLATVREMEAFLSAEVIG